MDYDEWVKAIFSYEEEDSIAPAWVDVDTDNGPELSERETLTMVTRLFESSGESLKDYSDKQVADGLKYLTNEAEDSIRGIYNIDIPAEERLAAIRSIYSLFRDCLACRCDNCCIDDRKPENPLNMFCYMFWDASQISFYGVATNTNDDCRDELLEVTVDVLEKTLMLPCVACQEAALHGLGHAKMDAGIIFRNNSKKEWNSRIEKIIEHYIDSMRPSGKLLKYARQAKTGMIL